MKTELERPLLEPHLYITIFTNHSTIVVNERLDYDYFFWKVGEYIWVGDMNKFACKQKDKK